MTRLARLLIAASAAWLGFAGIGNCSTGIV